MAFPRPSLKEIQDRIWNKVRQNTQITANIDSSVIGLLVKVMAKELDLIWGEAEQVSLNSQISTAVGGALDNWGLEMGVPRNDARKATTLGSPKSVRFTNTGSLSATVPVGTRVWNESSPQLAFFTVEGLTLAAGQSDVVHATASETGGVYNVGIGQLNRHNVPNVSVTVTNILPIQNGELRESDASYRDRLLQEMKRRRVLNVSNLSALLRSVPGVQDVFVLNLKRGNGTADCVVIPYSYTGTSEIIAECNRLLQENVDAGLNIIAKPPRYRQLSVSINLRFTPAAGDRREAVRESVRQQIRSRVDNLPVETGDGRGSLFVGQLLASAQLADDTVLDATMTLGLDDSPLGNDGELRIGIGERIVLTALEVN
jgi:uncharacterized phage protein gp47/JayE